MFKVGDKIVYPMHGAGTIESIEEREILGEKQKYYVMKMPVGDIKVMVPTKNAELIGVRDVVSNDVAQNVLEVLSAGPTDLSTNWNKRYRENVEKLKSGLLPEVAKITKLLILKDRRKSLSNAERKMLSYAKSALISEIGLSKNMDYKEIEKLLMEKIG